MRIYYDQTIANQMNGGQPQWGITARALAAPPLYPMRWLYTPQVNGGAWIDDGMPCIFDNESDFSFVAAGSDPAKLLDLCQRYLAIAQAFRKQAPTCPLSFYGILPDTPGNAKLFGPALAKARGLLSDFQDFVTVELTSYDGTPAGFDLRLPEIDAAHAACPNLPMIAKLTVGAAPMTDAEWTRQLTVATKHPLLSGVCVWSEYNTTFDKCPPNYATIAQQFARNFPGGPALTSRTSLTAVSDQAVSDQLKASAAEAARRMSTANASAAYWSSVWQAVQNPPKG